MTCLLVLIKFHLVVVDSSSVELFSASSGTSVQVQAEETYDYGSYGGTNITESKLYALDQLSFHEANGAPFRDFNRSIGGLCAGGRYLIQTTAGYVLFLFH